MTIALLLCLSLAAQEAEAKVREAIATLEKALVGKDESLEDHLDFQSLLREMERRGSIPDTNFGRGVRRLEENLSTLVAAPGALNGGWERIVPLNVRVSGGEANAFCRVTIGGKRQTFRVWLTRIGDAWKTYDLENMDGSYRLSVIGLQYAPGVNDDEDRQALRDGVMALQRGAVALTQGKPEAARDALSMARRCTPPEYVLDWIELTDGLAQDAMGDTLLALKAADRVLGRQKDLAVAHRLKATCHARLGEHAQAVAAAHEYLKLVGGDAEMWSLVGECLEGMGKTDEAAEACRKGAASDPEDVHSRWTLGRLLVEQGKPKEAAAAFSAAVKLGPNDDLSMVEIAADGLHRAGAHAEALALADQAAVRWPEEVPVLVRRGRGLRTVGRLKDAEETLRRASRLHPSESEISRELVLVLAQSGRDAEAQALMKEVADGDPLLKSYVAAFVHAAAGRTAGALEELRLVFREEPLLFRTMAWVEKEPVFEKVRVEKIVADARATRDYWSARMKTHLPAEEMLRIARERSETVPDDALACFDQGRALRRLRRYAEAEALLRKAVEKDKRLSKDELGRALAAQNKLEEALAVVEEEIRRGGPSGMALHVAVYAIAGKRDAAIKALQALLEKHPTYHSAAVTGDDLDEFRKLPAVQDLLRKARAKLRK